MTISYFVDEEAPSHVRERRRQTGQTPETGAQSSPSSVNGETHENQVSLLPKRAVWEDTRPEPCWTGHTTGETQETTILRGQSGWVTREC